MAIHAVSHREPLVKGGRRQRYCGPAAISALTGRTAECGAAWINHLRGKPVHHVVGYSYTTEVKDVLGRLGYHAEREGGAATLGRWLDERGDKSAPYLVVFTNHFVTVKGNRLYDSHHRDGVHVEKSGFMRRKVVGAYRISERADAAKVRRARKEPLPAGAIDEAKAKVAAKRKAAAEERAAKKAVLADPRIVDPGSYNIDPDGGIWIDLQDGYHWEDCSCLHEWSWKDLLDALGNVEEREPEMAEAA